MNELISEDQFRDCYSIISFPILLVEGDGRVRAANPAATREFGASGLRSAPDPSFLQDFVLEDGDVISDYLRRCSRTGEAVPQSFAVRSSSGAPPRYSFYGRLLNPAGEKNQAQVLLYIRPQEKVVREFLFLNEKIHQLSREIERRRALEEERRDLLARERAAKEEAEKLFFEAREAAHTKSLFLAQMSHEIRTPLNAILGFADLLMSHGAVDEEQRSHLGRIEMNGRHLLRIIDDILDLSKFEAGQVPLEMLKFSFIEMLDELVQTFRPLAVGKGLDLVVQIKTAIPQQIHSDPSRMRQVFANLIGNALKFTERGQVGIDVSFLPASSNRRSALSIEISDTGVGMSEAQQRRIFRAFEQGDPSTNRRFGGTGLGLVISQRISRALGGDLDLIRSQEGVGSSFRLTLPTGEAADSVFISRIQAPAVRVPVTAPGKERRLLSRRLLLAEDSDDGAVLATLFLEREGAKVTRVADGFAAVEAGLNGDYDLILMDIQMPGMDGLEATQALRTQGYERPIIALTAHALQTEVRRSLQAGCNAHITKPINKSELIQSIVRALDEPSMPQPSPIAGA